MSRTDDILAELESLGATGEIPVEVSFEQVVEAPTPSLLQDECDSKMIQLAYIVISELENLIGAASRMKDAVVEMRTALSPTSSASSADETIDDSALTNAADSVLTGIEDLESTSSVR